MNIDTTVTVRQLLEAKYGKGMASAIIVVMMLGWVMYGAILVCAVALPIVMSVSKLFMS